MQNVKTSVNGNKLVVEIDLTQRFGASDSGKTIRVASTEGNVSLEGYPEIKMGINAYTSNHDYVKGKKQQKK